MNSRLSFSLDIVQDFLRYFWQNFISANCMQSSAALAYTTLLALVPLTVVSFSIFTAFPGFHDASIQIQNFIFRNFVPNSGEVIQEYILSFSSKAKQLTGTGIIFLMITAIMMMSTIEKSLNIIWKARKRRKFLEKFIIYWAILTLGPLLMGIGLAVTSYVVSMPFVAEPAVLLTKKYDLLKRVPLVMEIIAFTLLYLLVPVVRVRFRNALAGGLCAALLFELAKSGFTAYITNFPTYQTVYGTLATIPIFLIWVYVSWTIALIGAVFAYTLKAYKTREIADRDYQNHPEIDSVLRILYRFWNAQGSGTTLNREALADLEPKFRMDEIENILTMLEQTAVIAKTEHEEWLLLKDLSRFSLADLYRRKALTIPLNQAENVKMTFSDKLSIFRQNLDDRINESLDVPISALFQDTVASQADPNTNQIASI